MTVLHEVQLIAVVVDGSDILLTEHRDGGPQLPTGLLHDGEDVLTGLRRCVGQLTGLVVAVDRLSGVYTQQGIGISLVFTARHVVGQLRPGPRIKALRWVSPTTVEQVLPATATDQVRHALTSGAEAVIGHQPAESVSRLRVAR